MIINIFDGKVVHKVWFKVQGILQKKPESGHDLPLGHLGPVPDVFYRGLENPSHVPAGFGNPAGAEWVAGRNEDQGRSQVLKCGIRNSHGVTE